jgi:hypothetical protein
MKSNETSFRRSRAPKTIHQASHKVLGTEVELRNSISLSARGERRKLAAEERRLKRKQKRRKDKGGNGGEPPARESTDEMSPE